MHALDFLPAKLSTTVSCLVSKAHGQRQQQVSFVKSTLSCILTQPCSDSTASRLNIATSMLREVWTRICASRGASHHARPDAQQQLLRRSVLYHDIVLDNVNHGAQQTLAPYIKTYYWCSLLRFVCALGRTVSFCV